MNQLIDTQQINQRTDLLTLAGQYTRLVHKSNTGGGEYSGACPFCGGTDRFSVQPHKHIWMCRNCAVKWQDPIAFGRRLWPGLGFVEICQKLIGNDLPVMEKSQAVHLPGEAVQPVYTPPDDQWQTRCMDLVGQYEAALWQTQGQKALAYLRARGLKDETIKHFRLGYKEYPRAISIPCIVNGVLWYLKYRLAVTERSKYICEAGSRPAAIFNADVIIPGYCALAVEGEIDCMVAWQEFRDFLPTFTLGSTTNHPDLAVWGKYLIKPNFTLILPDNDIPGEIMAGIVSKASVNPILVSLPDPDCKDLNDYLMTGGNLAEWAMGVLNEFDPLPDSFDVLLQQIGGVSQKLDSKTVVIPDPESVDSRAVSK